ncbi:hypothetical protein HID58_046510 [Brassica napus]|uniref:Uncharacterized protein n=1 Tax=Brassica napus TaxID=3708 RepID=A0ABQ8AWP7_BRANA|nr:hypothetical protein HID58_046510 [Brassica napus]
MIEMAPPLPPLKARNIRRGGDLMGVDILLDSQCGRCFLHRRRQVAAIVGGQECEAKSETEEDEELRSFVLNSKFNCVRVWYVTRARWSVTEQATEDNDKRRRRITTSGEDNAALGGEKRRKRRRVTEKLVEEQQSNEQEALRWIKVRWTDMKQATDSVTRDRKCNCCSSIWHKGEPHERKLTPIEDIKALNMKT